MRLKGDVMVNKLAQECEKLEIEFEQNMAEIGMVEDFETWPNY